MLKSWGWVWDEGWDFPVSFVVVFLRVFLLPHIGSCMDAAVTLWEILSPWGAYRNILYIEVLYDDDD